MNFIDGNGGIQRILPGSFDHPLLIIPMIFINLANDGGAFGADLKEKGVGICFNQHVGTRLDLKFIYLPLAESGDEQLPYTRAPPDTHGMASTVPSVKIAYHADSFGVGSPDCKVNSLGPIENHWVGP